MNDDSAPAVDPDPIDGSNARGRGILRATVWGTVVFVVLGIAAAAAPDSMTTPFVVVSLLEFLLGMIVFGLAFLRAIERSRTEAIGIGGLFFASGSAPKRVQVTLMMSLAVQVVVSIVIASIRLYTPLAFGVLAPMWSLGFAGLWVSAYGVFPEREPELTRAARRDADRRAHRSSMPPKGGGTAE